MFQLQEACRCLSRLILRFSVQELPSIGQRVHAPIAPQGTPAAPRARHASPASTKPPQALLPAPTARPVPPRRLRAWLLLLVSATPGSQAPTAARAPLVPPASTRRQVVVRAPTAQLTHTGLRQMRRRVPPQFIDRAVSLEQTPVLHQCTRFWIVPLPLPMHLIKIWQQYSILRQTQWNGGCLILDDQLWSPKSLYITVRIAAGID